MLDISFYYPSFLLSPKERSNCSLGLFFPCRKGKDGAEKWSHLYFLFMAIISQTRNSPLILQPTLLLCPQREECSVKWHPTGSQQGGLANKGGYALNREAMAFKHTFYLLPLWYMSQCGCWQKESIEPDDGAAFLFQEVWFHTFSGLSALFSGNTGAV